MQMPQGPVAASEAGEYRPDPSLREGVGPVGEGTTLCQQMDGTMDKRWEGQFPWSSQAKHLLQVLG